jgi:hypothetical protein
MPDEKLYPTMKLLRCKKCRLVFASRMGGSNECPDCSNTVTEEYRPDQEEKPLEEKKRLAGKPPE